MLAFVIPMLLLTVHRGQCIMKGVADIKLDGTSTSLGTITFVQNDDSSPVIVTGTVTIPGISNTTHVRGNF